MTMTNSSVSWGSSGPAVQRLQEALAAGGLYHGAVDGHFGADTYNALVAFQAARGLPIDGVASERFWNAVAGGASAGAAVASGARGASLHFGVNRIDSAHYGTDGALHGCENDARAMEALAASRGFATTTLLTEAATSDAVLGALERAAADLRAGDTLFVSYAGHGANVQDFDGTADENDGLDETWCLYDRMVLDDELYVAWGKFARGVRILLLSDSCHSGTISRELGAHMTALERLQYGDQTTRNLDRATVDDAVARHRSDYQGRANPARGPIAATVITISGCQDNQLSQETGGRGVFSTTLERVWAGGAFRGGYRAFHRAIVAQMQPTQSPNLTVGGAPNAHFEAEQPFTIAARREQQPFPLAAAA
jgi:metacaspase-1